jgi:hypothetical protein
VGGVDWPCDAAETEAHVGTKAGAVGRVAFTVTGEFPSAFTGTSCVRAASNSSKVQQSSSPELSTAELGTGVGFGHI